MTSARLQIFALLIPLLAGSLVAANNPDSRFPESPQIHENGTVTFRVVAKNAEQVELKGSFVKDGQGQMKRSDKAVWEVTVGPLDGGIYDYVFSVDGTIVLDPHNRSFKKWRSTKNLFEIPSIPAAAWDLQNVPHGTVRHHDFFSNNLKTHRQVVVYTPAGYDERSDKRYPVLFLLHGSGDDATAWTEVGKAHRIADNLIAAKKIDPLIIVMPHGHASRPGIKLRELDGENWSEENFNSVYSDFFQTLIPFVEENYTIANRHEDWAIAGLSMGGGQSLRIGLNHPDRFATIGAFSSGVSGDVESLQIRYERMKRLDKAGAQRIWIACGRDDFLVDRNQAFHRWLTDEGVDHSYKLTSGGHSWPVWRDYLEEFLSRYFVLSQNFGGN